ncbi:hypothetical protein Dimus_010787 [Dionaea muscipula]
MGVFWVQLLCLQRLPMVWKWYSWICPVSWSVYGLVDMPCFKECWNTFPIVDDPDLAFMSEAVIKLSSILIPRNTFPTTDIFHKVISLLAYLVCTLLLKIIEFVLAIVKQMRSVVSEVANNFPTAIISGRSCNKATNCPFHL